MNAIGAFFVRLWLFVSYPARWARAKYDARRLYRAQEVEDLPDDPRKGTVYLAGEADNWWAASMLCPCGCGEEIQLNLLQQVRPSWTVGLEADGTVSLTPSVWRQKGCKSHFVMRGGRIIWC